MINEAGKLRQSILRIRDQLFETHFDVIVAQFRAVRPSLANHPIPVESRDHCGGSAVPPLPPHVSELGSRQRNVAAIANNMHNQGIRNRLFDPIEIEQMLRGAIGPAAHVLAASHFAHHNSQKISTVFAFGNDLCPDGFRVQP